MKSVGDIIVGAIKEFDTHGWCTGQVLNRQGQMCAVGGVSKAMTGEANVFTTGTLGTPKWNAVMAALASHLPQDYHPDDGDVTRVITYNNSRTSYQEVRDWFEKAALNEGVTLE